MRYATAKNSLGCCLGLVAYCLFLASGPAWSLGQDGEAQFNTVVPALECPSITSSSWPLNIVMAMALTYALLEYAQLFLLLIGDQEAARACFQQRCPAALIMKDERSREQLRCSAANTLSLAETQQGVESDHISTNILSTTPRVSEEKASGTIRYGPNHTESQTEDLSICGCEEEDYLVALEDDVRRPCGASTHHEINALRSLNEERAPAAMPSHVAQSEHSSTKVASPGQASAGTKASAAHTSDETAHAHGEVQHRFQHDLLPAAEENLMDAL